jgi:hypothetical protein
MLRIQQDNIEIALQAHMLETVVKNNDLRLATLHSPSARTHAIPSYDDRYAQGQQLLRHQKRLVAGAGRVHEKGVPIAHDPPAFLFGRAFVSATDNRHTTTKPMD